MNRTFESLFRYLSDVLRLDRPFRLGSTLEVVGDSTLTGDANLGGDLDVAGNTTLQGTTARIGGVDVVIGTGDPDTVTTAPQGSVFLRTDGASSTGIYTNTNGSTAWSAVGSTGGTAWTQQHNAAPSGASVNVSGFPSDANEIVISIIGVSSSSNSIFTVQLGDSGGIEATGYTGGYGGFEEAGSVAGTALSHSTYFGLHGDAINQARSCVVTLRRFDGNTWVCSGNMINQGSVEQIGLAAGEKTLSGVLTQIQVNTSAGNFSGGNIRVAYR